MNDKKKAASSDESSSEDEEDAKVNSIFSDVYKETGGLFVHK